MSPSRGLGSNTTIDVVVLLRMALHADRMRDGRVRKSATAPSAGRRWTGAGAPPRDRGAAGVNRHQWIQADEQVRCWHRTPSRHASRRSAPSTNWRPLISPADTAPAAWPAGARSARHPSLAAEAHGFAVVQIHRDDAEQALQPAEITARLWRNRFGKRDLPVEQPGRTSAPKRPSVCPDGSCVMRCVTPPLHSRRGGAQAFGVRAAPDE